MASGSGIAPLQPAEFVIFRIGQWTADHQGSTQESPRVALRVERMPGVTKSIDVTMKRDVIGGLNAKGTDVAIGELVLDCEGLEGE
jgi:hypothetical protein